MNTFLFSALDLREVCERLCDLVVCGDIVAHLAVIVSTVSIHIKVACTCEAEEDSLLLACLLALESLRALHLSCLEYRGLLN